MSATNRTTHYELPQFTGTDKPTFTGDMNSAFAAIDGALHAHDNMIEGVEVKAEENAQAIEAVEQRVGELDRVVPTMQTTVNANTRIIDALDAQAGKHILTTNEKTFSGAINELDSLTRETKSKADASKKITDVSGTCTTAWADSITTKSGEITRLGDGVELEAGMYIIKASVYYNYVNSNGTRGCVISENNLTSTGGRDNSMYVPPVVGSGTTVSNIRIIDIGSTRRYYPYAHQTSGSNVSASGYICAVRLR